MFRKIAEFGDRLSSHPIFLVVFNTLLVFLWFNFGTDLANIFISIITAELVLLSAGATRRSFIAIHAKLDEMILAFPSTRDELTHVEDKDEKEIIELRV